MSKFFKSDRDASPTDASSPDLDSEKKGIDPEDSVEEHSILSRAREAKREIGLISAIFLIFNRVLGTGIFATPGTIFRLSGSVGLALFVWVIGLLIALSGTLVYMEFGTGIPRNGGEKNYLEFIYKRPKFAATGLYAGYAMLLGWAGSNSTVFGEYVLIAANKEVDRWNQRAIGLACITTALLIHGTNVKYGLWLQNFIGIIKLLIVLLIVVSGWAALGGALKIEKPGNFNNAFAGTGNASAYGIVTAIFNVIWSFIGYSNANYALSEVKNPVRTLKIAAPSAVIGLGVIYIFVNIAYFAAVPRDEILNSGRGIAASFFRNVFGTKAERALSAFVAISAFGNVLSVIFSQGRIVQEMGREGILPFSGFFASNRPFNAPLAGLLSHWVVSIIIMLAPPPGDAYNFILNTITYPLSLINILVSGGLLWVYKNRASYEWYPPFKATWPVVLFFFLSNIYLVIAPFVPPTGDESVYESLPYYLHCLVGIGILLAGLVYWVVWAKVLPKIGGYTLQREVYYDELDGWERARFVKGPKQE